MTRIVEAHVDEFTEAEIRSIPDLEFSVTTMEVLKKKYCSIFRNMCGYEDGEYYIRCPFSRIVSNDYCDFRKCDLLDNISYIQKMERESNQRSIVMKNIKLIDRTYDRIMEDKQ